MSKTKWFVVRKLPHQSISFNWRNSEAQKCCTLFTRSPFPLWGLGSKLTQGDTFVSCSEKHTAVCLNGNGIHFIRHTYVIHKQQLVCEANRINVHSN